jgi:4-amino-4-deoxy-L-arabinose transferase-like glycosyltransferase
LETPARQLPVTLLLLAALALRIGWITLQSAEPDARLGDQFEYLQVGRNLLSAHELKFHDPRFEQDVYAFRSPGYPLLIAACGGSARVVRIVQALLDTSTVLAIYLLARRYVDPRSSLVAAAFVAFNPFLIYFTGLILTETLFTALLAWGMYLLSRRCRWLRLHGLLLLSASVLVRPSAMGLVILLPALIEWPKGWRAVLRSTALAGVILVIVLFPWAYRNAHHPQVRSWVWTTTNSGITTYDGFHDRATGASDQKPFVDEMKTLLSRMDEVERDAFLSQTAHEWIRSHPARSLSLMLSKIARTWTPIPLSSEYGSNRLYVAAGLLYSLPFDVLILTALWKRGIPGSAKVFLLGPAIYFTVIHALSVGSLRYRVPAEPPMAVLAGAAGVGLMTAARQRFTNGPSRRKSG